MSFVYAFIIRFRPFIHCIRSLFASERSLRTVRHLPAKRISQQILARAAVSRATNETLRKDLSLDEPQANQPQSL